MTYPETVCQELDKAIAHQMNLATRYEPKNSHRDRKVTREDIIKFLICMERGSLQAKLLKANLDITPGADGEKLMRDIARFTEPIRPGRRDTRNLRVKSWEGFVHRVAA